MKLLFNHLRFMVAASFWLLSTCVMAQPVVGFSAVTLQDSALCGDSVTLPLTIYNTGTSQLDIWLSDGYHRHDTMYASNISSDQIRKINLDTFGFMANTGVGKDYNWSLKLTPDGSELWAGDNWWDSVFIFNTSDMSPAGAIRTGDGADGIAFTPDGLLAVVCNRWTDSISLVDVTTQTVINTLYLDYPMDAAVTSDGQYAIVVAAGATNGNVKVRLSDFTIVEEIITNSAGDAQVVLSPDDRYAVVGRPWDNEIAVIDVESFTEVATFTGVVNPIGNDVTPDGKYVYFVDRTTGFMRRINLESMTMTSITMPQVSNARDLQIDQFGQYLYMSATNGYVYKVDLQTETVIDTLFDPGSFRGLEILRSRVAWASQDTHHLSIAAGDSAVVYVTFSATGLNGGVYTGSLFTFSNDLSSVYDTIALQFEVIGVPQFLVSQTCVNFDTVFQYGTNTSSLTLYNPGCDTLAITDVTSNLSEYTFSFTSSLIPPGDSITLDVTFSTTGLGSFPGSMTIETAVGDSVLCLTAISIAGPELSFSPQVINAVSNSCNDTLNYTIDVHNIGAQALIGTIGFSAVNEPTLQEALDSLTASYTTVTANIPTSYAFSDGFTGTNIGDGGGDMYDGGNYLSTNLGGNLNYSNNAIATSGFLGTGGTYFTFKGTGLFVFAADINAVSDFQINGNLGADGSGSSDTSRISYSLGNYDFTGYIKRVYAAGDPSVNHIIVIPKTSGVGHYAATNTNDDYHEIDGLTSVTRIYHLLYAGTSGAYINDADAFLIMSSFIDLLYGGSDFISVDTANINLAAGDSTQLNVQLRTNKLLQGSYTEYIYLNTNDPLTPQDSIEVNLVFDGQAELVAEDTCLFMDSVFQFGSVSDSFWIVNTGCDTLIIDSIVVSNSEFVVQYDTSWLFPGDTQFLYVTFSPDSAGLYSEQFTIYSDLNDTSFCVTAMALLPPSMVVSPLVIDTVLIGCADTLIIPVQIQNAGSSSLFYSSVESSLTADMSLASVLTRLSGNSTPVSNAIPNRFDFSDGITGIYIVDGGSDMYDFGNYLYSSSGGYIPYSNNALVSSTYFGTSGQYFTHKGTGLFALAADIDNLSYFRISGGTGHDGGGVVDTLDMLIQKNGITYRALIKRVYGETEPSVNHIFLLEDNGSAYDVISTASNSDLHYLYSLNGVNRLYYLAFGSTNGGFISRNQMQIIIDQFLNVIHGDESWMSIANPIDTVAGSSALNTSIMLTSTGLVQGTYNGYFAINANDPLNPTDTITVTFELIGAAIPEYDSACIGFDTTLQFGTYIDTFTVVNSGCDTLNLNASLTNSGEYAIDTNFLSILPGDTDTIIVTFTPLSTGAYLDTLVITSNGGDTSICLSSFALPPPTIAISPSLIDTIIYGCDDTLLVPVTIHNTGASDLTFSVSGGSDNSLEEVLLRFNSGFANVTSQIPSPYAFSDGITGFSISDGGGDMYDGGNYLYTNFGGSLAYSDDAIVSNTLLGTTGRYFTRKVNQMFIFAADLDGVTAFNTDGNLGADGSGNYDLSTVSYTLYGTNYTGFIRRVYNAGDPSVNHLIIVPNAAGVSQSSSTSTNSDYHLVQGLVNTDRIYYLLFARTSGGYVNNSDMLDIMSTFLQEVIGPPQVVSIPVGDTVVPGDSSVVNMILSSTGLTSGIYNSVAYVNSNDPLTPLDSITITLEVVGEPIIALSDSCITTDTIFQYATYTDTVTIYNRGCDSMQVDSIYASINHYTFMPNSMEISPGDSAQLIINYTPLLADTFADTIFILNNASDTMICVNALALPPPAISIAPASIDTVIVGCDDTLYVPITITNTGQADLVYTSYVTEDSVPSLDSVLARLVMNSESISQAIPNRYDFTEGVTGIRIIDGGNDMYNFGNYLYSPGYGYLNYSNNVVATGNFLGTNTKYFTHKGSGLFVMAGDLNNLSYFYTTGSSGTGGAGFTDTASFQFSFNGRDYIAFVRRIWGATDPSINHLWIMEYDASVTQSLNTNTASDYNFIGNLSSVDRLYYILFSGQNGSYMSDDVMRSVAEDFMIAINVGSDWLSFGVKHDTLVPAEDTVTYVRLSSTGMEAGFYSGNVFFVSNDPLLPLDSISITLEVVGEAVIDISDSCLVMDTTIELSSSQSAFEIYNTGCDTLVVDSVVSSSGLFTMNPSDTLVYLNDTAFVSIVFSPVDTGLFADTLWFYSNSFDTAICVSAYARPRPIIALDTDTLYFNVTACCDTTSIEFEIHNEGLGNLHWNAVVETGVSDDFDGGIDAAVWASNTGISATNCGAQSGDALYFTDNTTRIAETVDLDASGGGNIEFYLKIAYSSGGTCETADGGENVVLEYSTNGGSTWTLISTYLTGPTYQNFTYIDQAIPAGAQTSSTRFRWRQVSFSGSCCDHWAIDELELTSLAAALVSPSSDTTLPGDSTTVTVDIDACGLPIGTYNQAITIFSDDPLNPVIILELEYVKPDTPAAPIINDLVICEGDSTLPFIAVGENIRWYSDTALTTIAHFGDTFNSGIDSVGVYTFFLTQTIDSCEGRVDTFVFSVNAAPTQPLALDTFACESGTIPDLFAAGSNIRWYSDTGLTILEATGQTFSTGLSTPGFYTFYVTDSLPGCPASFADTSTLFIDSIPEAPTSGDTLICFGDSVPTLIATGDSVRWYSDPGLSTLLATGNAYTPTIAVAGVYNYYVVQVDTFTKCFSPYTEVTITAQASPGAPVVQNDTACFGSPIPELIAAGTNISWYSDSNLTTLEATGDTFNTGQSAIGVFTYYVNQSIGTCVGPTSTVSLVISALPVTPIALDTSICFGEATPDLTADQTGLRWYADTGLTSLLYAGDTFSSGATAAGSYQYYVVQLSGACEGDADTATLMIHANPVAPIGVDTFICFGQTTPDLTANGSWNQWYSDSGLTLLVDTGANYSTGQTAVGTYFYYVTDLDSLSGCEGGADTVSLTINNAPTQPNVADTMVCELDPIPDLIANGTFIQWYADPALDSLLYVGDTFSTGLTTIGGVFYVTDSLPGCPQGPADTVVLNIHPLPAPPSVVDTAACFGDSIPNLINTVSFTAAAIWFADINLTIPLDTGDTFNTGETAVGSYTYYVIRDSVCFSTLDSATLTIFGIPSPPVAVDTFFCEGGSEAPLVATGSSVVWYSDSALSSQVGTGDSLYTGQTSVGTYTYYATQGLNGCAGSADSAVLTIKPIPTAIIGTDTSICSGETIPTLSAAGINVRWYADSGLTSLLDTGVNFTPSPSGTGVFVYFATQTIDGCESEADSVVLNINTIPSAPMAGDTALCELDSVPDLIAAGNSIRWYSDTGLTSLVGMGNTYNSGSSGVGSYNFYATQTVLGCESEADTATLVINAAPNVPVASSDTSVCEGALIPAFSATGLNLVWYDSAGGVLGIGNSFTPVDSVAGLYQYYVQDSLPGCPASEFDTATFVVHPIPTAPLVTDTVICSGQTVPDLMAIGVNVEWFDDAALTNLVDTGTLFATGQTAVGTYTYYVRQSSNGCVSPADSITLTIAPVPSVPTSTDTSICFGQTAVLYGLGTNLRWYSDTGLSNLVGTGDSISASGLSVGLSLFFVTDSLSGCPASDPDTASISVISLPTAPVAGDTSICNGDSIPPLTATGSGIYWYSDAGLTSLVDSGNVFVTGDTAVGSYLYYLTQTVSGCAGAADSARLTIHAIPTAPLMFDTSVCLNDTVPDLQAVGQNVRWYLEASALTQLDTGNNFSTGQSAAGSFTYFATQTVLGCESSTDSATLTIHSLPSPPSIADTSICFGATVPSFSASGGSIAWYSDTSLVPLILGDTFMPSVIAADTFTYLVTDNVNGCEGPSDTFVLIVHPLPSPPGLSDTSVCETEAIPTLSASGTGLTWYSDTSLSIVVATGPAYNPGALAVGSYAYYVTQNALGCEGPADTITLDVTAQPGLPAVLDTTVCETDTIPSLTASGTDIRWYSDTALTTLVGIGNSFNSGQSLPGSYSYYVTQSVGTCESQADSATLVILSTPNAPLVSDTAICDGETIPPLVAIGTSIQWYQDSTSLSVLFSGDTFATGQTLTDTHSYYASQSALGCESPRTLANLIIKPEPSVPLMTDTANCFGASNSAMVAVGIGILWYDDASLTSLIGVGDSLISSESGVGSYTYYATQTVDGCTGPHDSAVFTIHPIPSSPLVTDTTVCLGAPVPILLASGTSVLWFADATLDTLVATGGSFTPTISTAGTFDFFVTQTANGCQSIADTATVIALPEPSVPSVSDTAICFGELNPVFNSGSATTFWYDDSAVTTPIDSGALYQPSVSAIGAYTYYVRNVENGCEGDTASFSFTIHPLPASPTLTDTQVCAGDTAILAGIGVDIRWYDDTALTNLVGLGDTFNTGQSIAGSFVYYATQTVNGCTSNWDSAIVTVLSPPSAPVALDTVICEGLVIPDLTANGANLIWYADAALDSVLASGSSFTTNESTEGTYHYYVTQSMNGCESEPDTSTLIITGAPLAPIASDYVVCDGEVVPLIVAQGTSIQWYDDTALSNLVGLGSLLDTQLTQVGTYHFYATQTENGCAGPPDTATVVIIAIPPAPSVNDTSICFGGDNPAFHLGNENGIWYDNESLLIPVWEGDSFKSDEIAVGIYTYYVTQQDSGCESAADTITFSILPRPLVTLNSYSEAIITGDSVELQAFNAIAYTWSPAAGLSTVTGNSVMASPQVTTTYTVTGVNEEGCSNDTNATITVMPLGLASALSDRLILSAYPNPNRGKFTIELVVPVRDDYEINIINKLGEIVQTSNIQAEDFVRGNTWRHEYSLGHLASGIYLIHLHNDYALRVLKVVVQ
ncbi:MAG: DUF1573 domain-containing protein [Cryomorphaceae bacterium]